MLGFKEGKIKKYIISENYQGFWECIPVVPSEDVKVIKHIDITPHYWKEICYIVVCKEKFGCSEF